MRILHLIQRYWPAVGGAETYLHEISRRLVRDGHQVSVWTTTALDISSLWDPRKRSIEQATGRHEGVSIRRFPIRHLPGAPVTFPVVRRLMITLADLSRGQRAIPLLNRMAKLAPQVAGLEEALAAHSKEFDLIGGMTIGFESLHVPALKTAQQARLPFLIYPLTHFGASDRDRFGKYYTMPHQLALCRAADAVLAQTEFERSFLVDRQVRPERVTVAGAGVNPTEVSGGDGERFRRQHSLPHKIVFTIGTLCRDKGSLDLVRAMARLWQAGSEAHLVLAGSPMDDFVSGFRRLPPAVRDRCTVLGRVSAEEKRDLLAAGDILVLPSRTDSFGIAYLEAWINGKPVVGAKAGGVQEVIQHGVDGLLVPYGNPAELGRKIQELLRDPALAHQMGASGQVKVINHHTWDHVYSRVRPIYERFADGR